MTSKFIEYLRSMKDDRGAMAELRRAIHPAQNHRAWPLLARFGGVADPLLESIAAFFAYHPEETKEGNLGTTCRQLSGAHNTFEGRFRRILACDRDSVFDHIRPVILAAKAKDVRVNYEQLLEDLRYWSARVKAAWATEFWGSDSEEKET